MSRIYKSIIEFFVASSHQNPVNIGKGITVNIIS